MGIPSEGNVPLRHVAVDGPIGVGKTSLVEMLAAFFTANGVISVTLYVFGIADVLT